MNSVIDRRFHMDTATLGVWARAQYARPSTLFCHVSLVTSNPMPQTPIPKPETLNPKPKP